MKRLCEICGCELKEVGLGMDAPIRECMKLVCPSNTKHGPFWKNHMELENNFEYQRRIGQEAMEYKL